MLRSMTGFGSAQGRVGGVEYAVEIRSVNNRYYKSTMKLPEIWSRAESEFEKLLRQQISRGSIFLSVKMRVNEEEAAYHVNVGALNSYLDQLREVEIDANPTLRIDLGALLQLPGVCEPPPLEELAEQTEKGLMDLIHRALAALMEMRRREGDALRIDLLGQCDVIRQQLDGVVRRAPEVVKDYHQRLTARVQELTEAGRVKIDEDTLAREVAIYAERCDIAEEIHRLTGHLVQFRSAVDSPEPAGRKLDFIAQEMLREANTIASKANDADIARAVVEIKTAIDRIKEQVQNAE